MLSASRTVFGVHSVTPYSRTTGIPYGTLRVLKGASLKLSGELIEMYGGSFNYAWAVEDGKISGELSFSCIQIESFMLQIFFGATPTSASADNAGTITTLTNKNGATVSSATIGIASIAVASAATLKGGKYLLKAVNASSVAVYGFSDYDFSRGSAVNFVDDSLAIGSAAYVISTAGASTAISELGIRLIGGSGTIGMTSGDTAYFEILPTSNKSFTITIGNPNDRSPEFGAYLVSEPRANGESFSVDCFRCRAVGLPLQMEAKSFQTVEISAKVYYDDVENAVCRIRSLTPQSVV